MPLQASLRIRDKRSFVSPPHDRAATVAHAVFVGYRRVDQPVLALEHARAVARVDLPRPKPGIVPELGGRKTEDRPHPAAYVMPASGSTGLGDVYDRRQLIEQRRRVDIWRNLAGASRRLSAHGHADRSTLIHAQPSAGSPLSLNVSGGGWMSTRRARHARLW